MNTPTTSPIRPEMTMAEIQELYPSARRALFQRYHVGGCSSCAFQPGDTLAEVCRDHNILDVDEVIQHLTLSHEVDQRMQVEPQQVQAWLEAGDQLLFLDVRNPQPAGEARIPGAEPLDFQNGARYMQLPKETRIVFLCQSGLQSLDVAAYFAGHGFTQVYSVRGGADAWRAQLGSRMPG
jgi:rhodanese-related sulfurtransferase